MTDAGPSSAPKPFKSLTTALITPSASPPISHQSRDLPPPAKRPRLASTPSSLPSLTRSTPGSSSSRTDEEIQDDRRHSALRLLNVWSQLQERYVRPLDEDDIIDFEHDVIIKDKGVLKKHKRIGFGLLADSMRGEGDASATDYEDEDEDVDEIDAFASVPDSTVHERLAAVQEHPEKKVTAHW
ncbi:hypothetical protein QCA50_006737 [Cerrena zonata]|uniref:Uncharacterized protein n=1 Tax=Cerrena zonata TaxID=2478898 RepID=A0AAW0GKK5_9APHY